MLDRRGVAAGLALGVGLLWVLAFRAMWGGPPIHAYSPLESQGITAGEGAWMVTATLAQGVWIQWFVVAPPERLLGAWRRFVAWPGAVAALWVLAAALAALLGAWAFGHQPASEDEKTYLFQARLLLGGGFHVAPPAVPEALLQEFVVSTPEGWSGQYFWGLPALLAPFAAVGAPWLLNALLAGVLVGAVAGVADSMGLRRPAVVGAAGLVALSPMWLGYAATWHNSVATTACLVVTAQLLRSAGGGSGGWVALLAGLSVALAFQIRPYDVVASVPALVAVGGWGVASPVTLARRWSPALVAPILGLGILLATNAAVTGDPWVTGYALFNEGVRTFGLGVGPMGVERTFEGMLEQLLSWTPSLVFMTLGSWWWVAPLAAWPLWRPEARGRLAPLAVGFFGFVVVYAAYNGFSMTTAGPVYYLPLVPWLILAVVMGWDEACERLPAEAPSVMAAVAVGTALFFWPVHGAELGRTGAAAQACVALVAEAGITEGVVFVDETFERPRRSWVYRRPQGRPDYSDPVLFVKSRGRSADQAVMAAWGRGRPAFWSRCVQREHPELRGYDVRRGAVGALVAGGAAEAGPPR